MPKILVEKTLSVLDCTKLIVSEFKAYIGTKISQRHVVKVFKDYLKPMIDIDSLEMEVVKECGFFTRLFLKFGWISKKTPYFWWYHLFFPTIRTYETKNNFLYVIDTESIYRYILSYTNGMKVIFRFKYSSNMTLEKVSYRVVNADTSKGDDDDEQ